MTELAEPWWGRAGSRHLDTVSHDVRRSRGIVYTPDHLADLVLDQQFGEGTGPSAAVLDPACGAGVFQRALVRRIAADAMSQGSDVRGDERPAFLDRVARLVWAMDIDSEAVGLARASVLELVQTMAPGPLAPDYLAANFMMGDFLRDVIDLPGWGLPRHVTGNPPYVAIDRIPEADRLYFRSHYTSAFGRIDLYTLFMERASRLVTAGGSWAFITPDKFLTSTSARPVRELLSGLGSIRRLVKFDSHKLFPGAATVPCITVWDARPSSAPVEMSDATVTADGLPHHEPLALRVTRAPSVDRRHLTSTRWSLQVRAVTDRISADHPRLGTLAQRISAGLATGFNAAFVLDEAAAALIEPELMHRTVRGRDLQRFAITARSEFMLVPYTWDDAGTARLIDLDDYPRARGWLVRNELALRARHCVRVWDKAWWDLHDPVGLPLHQTPKVLVPDLARSNRFVADPGEFVPQHSAYYIVAASPSPMALSAVLNSPHVELVIRTHAPRAKDGFSRYRRQFLMDVPVPHLSAELAGRIESSVIARTDATTTELVDSLFGVDHDEVIHALRLLSGGSVR